MRLRIYVAGAISKGDRYLNVHAGILAGRELVRLGYAPMVPHLDAYMYLGGAELAWSDALDWDLSWVAVSDAVLRLPGESQGADIECEFAAENGIPVFHDIEDIVSWKPPYAPGRWHDES
jgi:hypothetical protein